jgi:Putative Ig domain
MTVTKPTKPNEIPGYFPGMLTTGYGYFVSDGTGSFSYVNGNTLFPISVVGDISVRDVNPDGYGDIILPGLNSIKNTGSDAVLLSGNSGASNFLFSKVISSFASGDSSYFTYGGFASFNQDDALDLYYFTNFGKLHVFMQKTTSNLHPTIALIGDKTVTETQPITFTLSATDPDNDPITYTATNLPLGASLNPITGEFTWTPGYSDAGIYQVTFTATEDTPEALSDSETITITVINFNRAPELVTIGNQIINEGDILQFTASAIDPDNDAVTLSASNLPTGATFNPTTGTFIWTPSLSDAGVYTITVAATDNGTPVESASTQVVITVGDNPTPVEQVQDLIDTVTTIDIPQNVENSYLANLHKVGQFILEGKITAALNQLNAFLGKVQQDYNQNLLTQEEYEGLIKAGGNLIDDLSN